MSYPHYSVDCHKHHHLVRDFHGTRPEIVVLCGSTRFVDAFNHWRKYLTEQGLIVLSIEVVTTQARSEDPQHVNPELKTRLDKLHKRKIDLADWVFVLNVGGYIGESTRSEIEYAKKFNKPVDYLEQAMSGLKGNTMDLKTPGRIVYNAYGDHAHWRTFDGRPMPTWEDIELDAVREHWEKAARELLHAFGVVGSAV